MLLISTFTWYCLLMLYKVVLTFKSVDETQCMTIQMKAIEQYFHAVVNHFLK